MSFESYWTLVRLSTCVASADVMPVNGESHVEHRVERVVFETDRYRVIGDVTLPPEGYQSRFSDSLNRADLSFVPLINVEIEPLIGEGTETRPFAVLGKSHIRIAYPLADSA